MGVRSDSESRPLKCKIHKSSSSFGPGETSTDTKDGALVDAALVNAAPVGDAVATVAWYDPENPTEELYAYATPAAAAAEFGLAELAVFDCLEGRTRHADGVCFRWQTDWPLPAHAVATRRRGVYRLGTEGRFRAQLGERDGFLGNFDSEGAAALV